MCVQHFTELDYFQVSMYNTIYCKLNVEILRYYEGCYPSLFYFYFNITENGENKLKLCRIYVSIFINTSHKASTSKYKSKWKLTIYLAYLDVWLLPDLMKTLYYKQNHVGSVETDKSTGRNAVLKKE